MEPATSPMRAARPGPSTWSATYSPSSNADAPRLTGWFRSERRDPTMAGTGARRGAMGEREPQQLRTAKVRAPRAATGWRFSSVRRALHPRCTEARTTRARRRRSPIGDQAAVAFRADCLIRGSGRPISLRLLSHGTRFPLQSPGVSGIGQGTAVLRQPNTAGRVVILVRCACGNGTVAPSQARTLHLSASGQVVF